MTKIIGQEKLIAQLNTYNIINLPHAMLFVGPKGCGKHLIASYLARKHDLDLVYVDDTLSNEDISSFNYRTIKTLYLIDLNSYIEKQQSIFLKALEDASSTAYFILLASSENSVLPTILNRCIKYRLEDYTIDQLKQIRNFNDEKIYQICKTPLQLIKANEVQIAQLASMCSNIINNISKVDISQVLRISNNINYAEDYNKFDFDLFFSTLQYTAYNDFIATKNLNSYKIYIFTAQYLQKLLYKNISKESFLLGYLSELKIFLG